LVGVYVAAATVSSITDAATAAVAVTVKAAAVILVVARVNITCMELAVILKLTLTVCNH
jgi:hypothetical protein